MTIDWSTLEGPYADDLVIIANSMNESVGRLLTWKMGMDRKRLKVNAGKTQNHALWYRT